MDFLKAEIERKRKQLSQKDVLLPDKKYFKRGDLRAKEEEEYWKKRSLREEPTDDASQALKAKEAASLTKHDSERNKTTQLPRKEVVRRLRERNEPIKLFGETDHEAFQRLRKLESTMPDINKGFKNDFKAAMDQVDQDYINEIIKQTGGDVSNNTDVSVKDDGTSREDIPAMQEELGQGNTDRDHDIILCFLKLVLRLWGERLNRRAEDVKRSQKGKLDSATHTQTVDYLKPLFKKLKNKEIDGDILESMTVIVKYLMNRNYIKANDTYLEMAIGNAPWPIGVTMVGIHARTGREKISSKYVAHVLNDETQRKYIQALKRLMTQSQILFPTDPIRSVEYQRPDKIT